MTIPPNYDSAFYQSGDAIDPTSNVVRIGADSGKILPFIKHDSLVTPHVYSCIGLVAINEQSSRMGLWHLFCGENEDQIRSDLLPVLEECFLPESTDIYLIGGREFWSERLVSALKDFLPQAGFRITDTALFGFNAASFDIAVNRKGEIHVVDHVTHDYLMHKPAAQKRLMHYANNLPTEAPLDIMHLSRPAKFLKELRS